MANITDHMSFTVYSEAEIVEMNSHIDTFINLLPINTSLTPEQRKRFLAMKAGNKVFVENVQAVSLDLAPEIFPAYLDLSKLDVGLENLKKLSELESLLNNAMQRLQDAKRIVGHQAYTRSTVAYQIIKIAAEAGVPNAKAAHDKLKKRFTANNRRVGRKKDTLI